jgi:hypothetical protein
MLKIVLFLTGLLSIASMRVNEFIPQLDAEKYMVNHPVSDPPQSFSWSNVDGVNYLTKNPNICARYIKRKHYLSQIFNYFLGIFRRLGIFKVLLCFY